MSCTEGVKGVPNPDDTGGGSCPGNGMGAANSISYNTCCSLIFAKDFFLGSNFLSDAARLCPNRLSSSSILLSCANWRKISASISSEAVRRFLLDGLYRSVHV